MSRSPTSSTAPSPDRRRPRPRGDQGGPGRGHRPRRALPGIPSGLRHPRHRRPSGARSVHEYVLVFIVAAAVTYVATPFVRRLAVRTGAFTAVRERDVHAMPIPRLGGVAIYSASWRRCSWRARCPTSGSSSHRGDGASWSAPASSACVGAFDDIRGLDWLTKLAGQMLAAGIMAFQGVQLLQLPVFGVTVLPAPVLVRSRCSSSSLDERGQLHRRPRRARRRGRRHRGAGLLRLHLPAVRPSTRRTCSRRRPSSRRRWSAAASASCRTTSTRPGSSWATRRAAARPAARRGDDLADRQRRPRHSVSGNPPSRSSCLLVPLAVLVLPLLDMVLAVVRRTRAGSARGSPTPEHLHHRMLALGHSHRPPCSCSTCGPPWWPWGRCPSSSSTAGCRSWPSRCSPARPSC